MSIFIPPSDPQLVHSTAAEVTAARLWTRIERVAFRFLVVYFALFWGSIALELATGQRSRLVALRDSVVAWAGHSVLGLQGDVPDASRGWVLAQMLVAVIVAALITGLWSALARRGEYDRFGGWCRIALRYYIAVMMLIYGGFKVVPSQFGSITLDQYAEPLGHLTPMGLLWAYMAYSPPYAMFAGFGEFIGGLLLFWRRTTTLGALIVIAVMSNVAFINYAYDVPVKQLSTNLLIGALALAAADLRRLVSVLILNAPTAPANQDFAFGPAIGRMRYVAKPTFILMVIAGPLLVSVTAWRSARMRSPLYGVYNVDTFVRDGRIVPADLNQMDRWRWITFSHPRLAAVRAMSDSMTTLEALVDTTSHTITLVTRRPQKSFAAFSYQRRGDTLMLAGTIGADSARIVAHRLDEKKLFRLIDE